MTFRDDHERLARDFAAVVTMYLINGIINFACFSGERGTGRQLEDRGL